MLTFLQTQNIGPIQNMRLDFGERINILTGDNGLGKSFVLDIAWWAMTRRWPADVNPKLISGRKAIPQHEDAAISFSFEANSCQENYTSEFRPELQEWVGRKGRPSNPGLVIYAMSDGSFAIWDPHRNYWKSSTVAENEDDDFIEDLRKEHPPAYVFSPNEVWDGLNANSSGTSPMWLCNGLIRDWASWQKENGTPFLCLKEVLRVLSPEMEDIIPGELTRISLNDVRDMPTIRMPYGEDVPVVHASAGIRRIMAMAYLLVWLWEEHKRAAKLLRKDPTDRITFLIDEIESHLHPSWQRTIIPALVKVMDNLTQSDTSLQLITATHSPLVMASLEPWFDAEKDAWFDLNLNQQGLATMSKQDFIKLGDAANWLTSDAFDLDTSYSKDAEAVLKKASIFTKSQNPDKKQALELTGELQKVLSDIDPFWLSWLAFCQRHKIDYGTR